MDEMTSAHIIRDLRREWVLHTFLSDFLWCVAMTIILFAISGKFVNISLWWSIPVFIFLLASFTFIRCAWQTSEGGIAQLLDQSYPSLEESSGLLIKPTSALNRLERLQQEKTAEALSIISTPLQIRAKLKRPALILLAALLLCFILYKLPYAFNKPLDENAPQQNHIDRKEKVLPQIAGITISVKPPAYTARPEREQSNFNLDIEEGASVGWQLKTTQDVRSVKLIFNDSASVSLKPVGISKQSWTTDNLIPAPGFYQVNIDSNLSDLYKIEIIRDLPPSIHIQTPKQFTTVDYGEPEEILTRINMTDDYAISDASIIATLASGSGEAVKFKEQKMILPGFIAGRRVYDLQKLLSLPSFGVKPGDELYFYVKATDNHNQETRSDIYIINLADTAQLMSLEGLANGINLKPEYFRSQRQIIIETEQLLKDKDTLSVETFKNRSNNLGIDQKMLRLRYGKFLGEEDESGVFEGGRPGDLGDPSNFSNADKLKDAFTDKHDNAEDATYLEHETKKKLRATLTKMWNPELQLRTFKPAAALPFEYKALRLLKDLQQQSRVYVAKTNQKTTPLDLQKRLTGDLSKITSPLLQKNIDAGDDPLTAVREALSLLEQVRITGSTAGISHEIMLEAGRQLDEKAIQQPSVFLRSVQALRKITGNRDKDLVNLRDVTLAENGLQKLLSDPPLLPAAVAGSAAKQLTKQYFSILQKKKQ